MEFSFEDEIPLEGGMHYRLIFLEGSGSNACTPDYFDGAGLNESRPHFQRHGLRTRVSPSCIRRTDLGLHRPHLLQL